MVKYVQGGIYDASEVINDWIKDMNITHPRYIEFNKRRAKNKKAIYLGKQGNKAVFQIVYPDGRIAYLFVEWTFNPAVHEDKPVNMYLRYKLLKIVEEEVKKLRETPEYKFMTHKKGDVVKMPVSLKKPEYRKKIFEAIRRGDVESVEKLRKEALKPELQAGKRSIQKKFERKPEKKKVEKEPEKIKKLVEVEAEQEVIRKPSTIKEEVERIALEVPEKDIEKLKEIAKEHGWKILLISGLLLMLR